MAVKVYRDEFKARDGGEIGITLNGDAVYPWDPSDPADVEACERKLEFSISWFADPVYFGKYPDSMRKQLGDRLPEFTEEERKLVQGSNDFYGMNHYTANYIRHKDTEPEADDFLGNLETLFTSKSGQGIGPETQSFWLRPNPQGFRELLGWISNRYGKPKIYVTENGTSLKGENDLSREEILDDEFRAEYFRSYLKALSEAVEEDGVNVMGYMAWSLMDNFEWYLFPVVTFFTRATTNQNIGLRDMRRASVSHTWITLADRRDTQRSRLPWSDLSSRRSSRKSKTVSSIYKRGGAYQGMRMELL